MTFHRQTTLAFVVVAVAALCGAQALASGAGDFIKSAADRTFASLGDTNLSDEERAKRFRKLLVDTFDLDQIARFTLGRYWRQATEEERAEFRSLFEEFVVLAYSNRFKNLTGKKFTINKVRELNDKESLVGSEIVMPDRPPVRVGWRVRNGDGEYKIVDVSVEGISMSVTQRDEFAAVIRSSGGRVAGLLHALRRKTGRD